MGDCKRNKDLGLRDLDRVLKAVDSFDDDPGGFLKTCAEIGIKLVEDPLSFIKVSLNT